MTDAPTQNDRFLGDMTWEDFGKLSGEERLQKIMQHDLKDVSGDELQARVEEIIKGATSS